MSHDNRNGGLEMEGRVRLGANVMVRRLQADISRNELAAGAAITPPRRQKAGGRPTFATRWAAAATPSGSGPRGSSAFPRASGPRWM